jgi:hypothetical protein
LIRSNLVVAIHDKQRKRRRHERLTTPGDDFLLEMIFSFARDRREPLDPDPWFPAARCAEPFAMSRWGRLLAVCVGVAMIAGGVAELAGHRWGWILVAAAVPAAGLVVSNALRTAKR